MFRGESAENPVHSVIVGLECYRQETAFRCSVRIKEQIGMGLLNEHIFFIGCSHVSPESSFLIAATTAGFRNIIAPFEFERLRILIVIRQAVITQQPYTAYFHYRSNRHIFRPFYRIAEPFQIEYPVSGDSRNIEFEQHQGRPGSAGVWI